MHQIPDRQGSCLGTTDMFCAILSDKRNSLDFRQAITTIITLNVIELDINTQLKLQFFVFLSSAEIRSKP